MVDKPVLLFASKDIALSLQQILPRADKKDPQLIRNMIPSGQNNNRTGIRVGKAEIPAAVNNRCVKPVRRISNLQGVCVPLEDLHTAGERRVVQNRRNLTDSAAHRAFHPRAGNGRSFHISPLCCPLSQRLIVRKILISPDNRVIQVRAGSIRVHRAFRESLIGRSIGRKNDRLECPRFLLCHSLRQDFDG